MIKMLVCSFYNTLIDEEDAIPTSTMLEIDRLRQKGIKVTLLTNRLQDELIYYNHDYPFIDYIISLNGSVILDVNKNKEMTFNAFTKKELNEIEKYYSKEEISFYTKDKVYNSIPQEAVYKVEIKNTNKKISKYYNSIFKIEKESYLEISKNSIYEALKKLKINSSELLCIIGNNSELELVNKLDNLYVVRNASSTLKNKADNIIKSNTKKGVEEVLKKY